MSSKLLKLSDYPLYTFDARDGETDRLRVKRAIINGRFALRYETTTKIFQDYILVECLDAPVKNNPLEEHPCKFPAHLVFRLSITNTGLIYWVKFDQYTKDDHDDGSTTYTYKFLIQPNV